VSEARRFVTLRKTRGSGRNWAMRSTVSGLGPVLALLATGAVVIGLEPFNGRLADVTFMEAADLDGRYT